MKAFVFPGQGAQFVGMGKDLYENSPLAKELFEKANDILKLKKQKKNLSCNTKTLCKNIYRKRTMTFRCHISML